MPFLNALGLTTLMAVLAATAAPRAAHAGTEPGAPTQEFVFGQLRRAGDASSFVPDPRWSPMRTPSATPTPQSPRTLVVVPPELPPGSVRSPGEIRQAQDRGQLFMLQ